MNKAFDAVYIHKLINKLIHTNISDIITKFIANYIKLLETVHLLFFPQRVVLSLTLFNIFTSDLPTPTHPKILSFITNTLTTMESKHSKLYQ